jgi:predicted RNA-binding Zn-ribbon protein involved in translation (DUF1610 family)
MTERRCPNCGSAEIYRREKGAIAHGYALRLDLDNQMDPTQGRLSAFVCANCGRVELYLHDLGLLAKIKANKNWTPPDPVACPACGKANDAGARFCDKCGAKLGV